MSTRKRSFNSASTVVPTAWRIVWAKDEYLSGSLVVSLVLWAIVAGVVVKVWREGWEYDEGLLAYGVSAILFTSIFFALFVHRFRSVRRLFATGHRVQAQIRQILPAKHQNLSNRLLNPSVVVHCRYRVAGDEYSTTFILRKRVASEFGKAIWLRVDAGCHAHRSG